MKKAMQVKKLQTKLAKHFAAWVARPLMIEIFEEGPKAYFDEYLAGKDDSAYVVTRADEAATWHLAKYSELAFELDDRSTEHVSLAARNLHGALKFAEAFANSGLDVSIRIERAALTFSLNVIADWREETDNIGQSLIKGLDTPLLDLRLTSRHEAGTLYRHFWFLLSLYCDARKLTLDISKYSYPADMSPYADVLADWRTTDLDKVQTFVTAMADFHLQEARATAHDEIAEFDTEDRMLFPHEILCWLRMREWVGLVNPVAFDHPLMKQPLAVMPGPEPLPHPETPLLDAVVAKFRDEFPGSFSE